MRSLLLARKGENTETCLKLLTIADSSATYMAYSPNLWILLALMLLLLAISLFASVELLLPEFFCEGKIQPLSVF